MLNFIKFSVSVIYLRYTINENLYGILKLSLPHLMILKRNPVRYDKTRLDKSSESYVCPLSRSSLYFLHR